METIDILLATYNGEKYVKEQIQSILNQTYSNFRLIISDDFSTDHTWDMIQEFVKKDTRIITYRQEKNLGYVKNFEFLLKKVENNFYMFSDQDDVWNTNKIEATMKKLKQTNSTLVFTDLQVVDENLELLETSFWKQKKLEKKIKKRGTSLETLYLNNYITGCTILAKKIEFDKILPFPQASFLIHDYWIGLIHALNGKITALEETTIQYRQHKDNQVGSKKHSEEMDSIEEIRKLFIQVKLEHFTIFVQKQILFPEKYQKRNKKALQYFEHLEKVKKINFRQWFLFFILYQYEDIDYILLNFLILNMPIVAKMLFAIRKRRK